MERLSPSALIGLPNMTIKLRGPHGAEFTGAMITAASDGWLAIYQHDAGNAFCQETIIHEGEIAYVTPGN